MLYTRTQRYIIPVKNSFYRETAFGSFSVETERAVAMSGFCVISCRNVRPNVLKIYKISTNCNLNSKISTQSRPFSLETYPISLENCIILPFRAKIAPVATSIYIKINAHFLKKATQFRSFSLEVCIITAVAIYFWKLNGKSV